MTTSDEERVKLGVEPNEAALRRINEIKPWALKRTLALAFFRKPSEKPQKPSSVVTTFPIDVGGIRYLVTADHVFQDEGAGSTEWLVFDIPRGPDGEIEDGKLHRPYRYPISSSDIIWRNARLDAAILNCPPGLHKHECFDAVAAIQTTAKVREGWNKAAKFDAYHLVCVSGLPNFMRNRSRNGLDLGAYPIPGFIVSAVHPEKENPFDRPSQLTIDIGNLAILPEVLEKFPHLKFFAEQLKGNEDNDYPPLGGLSGGPIVVVLDTGPQLVGVFSQARQGLGHVKASPWDLVFEAFDREFLSKTRLR